MAETLVLRSLIDPKFSVEVDGRVIKSCSILQNVQDCTNNDGEVEVNMTQKQIEKFVHLHNHFPSADSPKDIEWTNNFFREMPENEFKDFCFKADFLDSQRFIEASGDYAVTLIDEFDIDAIQDYFNIVDDFSLEERSIMEEHALEYFTSANILTPVNNADPDAVSITSEEAA